MADHLILSLQAPPFLIIPCSLHRRWGFSRRFPCGIRFSVTEFRLSSQLQLVNSTSHSQSSSSSSPFQQSNSAPEKLHLVSSTQLKDGSHVFRFGDASEIEKILEAEEKAKSVKLEKQNAKIAEEASEVSKKQGVKDLDHGSDAKKKPVNSDNGTCSEKEEKASANLSNIIKIKDRKRGRSPTKKKKEILASVNVSRSENKAEAEIANVSNMSSTASVPETIPSSSEEQVIVSEKCESINEDEITVETSNEEPRSSEVSVVETIPSSTEEKLVVSEKSESVYEDEITVKTSNVEPCTSEVSVALILPSSTEEKVVSENSEPDNEDEITVETSNVEALSSEVCVAVTIPSPTEEKVVSEKSEPVKEKEITLEASNVEPLSSEVMEKVSVNKIGDRETDSCQQITENRMEVQARSRSSTSHGSQSHDLEEVMPLSTIKIVDNLDMWGKPSKTIEAEENLVMEPTATAAVSPNDLILTSEATNHSVDEIAEKPVVDTSEVENGGENAVSTIEDEPTVRDTKTENGSISKTVNETKGDSLPFPAPETAYLQSTEMAPSRGELVSKALYLDSGFASLQRPFKKALAGREDAYFIFQHNWIGIADGISQWSFEGTNKGMYPRELMNNCQKIISDETAKISDPVQVLHRSVNETKSLGSSTALIAHLDKNELHIANIGDSGFIVIRDGTVLQKSSPMFHHFCFPLQIRQDDDVLKLAEVYHVNLEEDDVVITATDGLFDNLYEEEIVLIVCTSLEQNLDPQKVAELVAAKAQEVGGSEKERTPFGDAAREEGYDGHKGGKLDAVTVIVSLVKAVSV